MYVDFLAGNNYLTINKKLISAFGLSAAAYLSILFVIIEKAINKQTMTQEGFFPVDRKYIEKETSLSLEEQYACDAALTKAELLAASADNKDLIGLDLKLLFALFCDDDPATLTHLAKTVKVNATTKAKGRRDGIKANLVSLIAVGDPEYDKAIADFIDVAYEKGLCKKAQVELFRDEIVKYAGDDVAKQIELFKLATTLGYRSADWVISAYEKSKGIQTFGARIGKPQQTASINVAEISEGEVF